MKLTNKLLQQMIMEELRSLNEDDSIKLPGTHWDKNKKKNYSYSYDDFAKDWSEYEGKTKKQIKAMDSFKALKGADTNPKDNLLSKAEIEATVKAGGEAAEALKRIIASKPDLFKGVEWEWNKAAGDAKDPSTETDPADATKDSDATKDATADATKDLKPARPDPTADQIARLNLLKRIVDSAVGKDEISNEDVQFLQSAVATDSAIKWGDTEKTTATDTLTKYNAIANPNAPWKQDPLADIELTTYQDNTKSYVNPERQAILTALRNAFGTLSSTEITTLAGLTENKQLHEKASALELDDVDAALSKTIAFTADGKITPRSKIDLAFAKKIEIAIDNYINSYIKDPTIPSTKTDQLISAKRKYLAMLAKARKVRLRTDGGVLPVATPMATQVNKETLAKAKLDPSVVKAFDNYLGGLSSIEERIEKIANLSQKIIEQDTDSLTMNDWTNGCALINMMNTITRGADPSGAGFAIEGFMAMLVAGEKIGASNGAGDFAGPNGEQYSAKWLVARGSPTSQAASGFKNVGDKLTYIVGKKLGVDATGNVEAAGVASSAVASLAQGSDPTTISGIEIGLFDVVTTQVRTGSDGIIRGTQAKMYQYNTETLVNSTKGIISATGGTKSKFVFANNATDMFLDDAASSKFGERKLNTKYTVYFVNSASKEFEDTYQEAVNASTGTVATGIKHLTNLYKKLKIIQEESLDFANDKSLAAGFSMVQAYDAAKIDLTQLVNVLHGESAATPTVAGATAQAIGLEENKTKAEKLLDKLIKEVILNR